MTTTAVEETMPDESQREGAEPKNDDEVASPPRRRILWIAGLVAVVVASVAVALIVWKTTGGSGTNNTFYCREFVETKEGRLDLIFEDISAELNAPNWRI